MLGSEAWLLGGPAEITDEVFHLRLEGADKFIFYLTGDPSSLPVARHLSAFMVALLDVLVVDEVDIVSWVPDVS